MPNWLLNLTIDDYCKASNLESNFAAHNYHENVGSIVVTVELPRGFLSKRLAMCAQKNNH
jgi:hypothetical protein